MEDCGGAGGVARDAADSAYDVVINLQGIQHAEDWTAAGREFLRIMQPGRRLVMAEIVLGHPNRCGRSTRIFISSICSTRFFPDAE